MTALGDAVDQLLGGVALTREELTTALIEREAFGDHQYVLGPGTGHARMLAAERRKAVSRTAGWISPVVVYRGRVAGVWELTDDAAESLAVPTEALEAEAEHVAVCTGRARSLAVRTI